MFIGYILMNLITGGHSRRANTKVDADVERPKFAKDNTSGSQGCLGRWPYRASILFLVQAQPVPARLPLISIAAGNRMAQWPWKFHHKSTLNSETHLFLWI